ncbi:MAG: di-trans,poly-cis-decaprenylcistransferase [Acidobacteria bacterium 13_1_40CM_2_68_5]|nr:MAG: di-trans,poly-cis-decaprenylcistransferase [Acidobacteria bacterium 13_1_40CM_2_68_5]
MCYDSASSRVGATSPEERLLAQIDFDRLPRHIAIIMDGNGRWARMRSLPRVAGHRAGIAAVRDVVETSARLGCQVLTLYAFSVENWKRPQREVDTLMGLLREYLRKELETLQRNNIAFNVIGRVEELSPAIRRELQEAMQATRGNTGLLFNIALSYGGRAEIVDAVNRILEDRRPPGEARAPLDEVAFARYLYTAGQPDPDLLIRTSGEMRISNFLLWQIAYAEIWVSETLWPDFRKKELLQAIVDYQKRERRYGRVGSEPEPVSLSPGKVTA